MNNTIKIVLSVAAIAGIIYYFSRKKPVVVQSKGGIFGKEFTADIKKRVEEAWKKSGSKLAIEKWWEEQNKKAGATLSADGKPDIFTIKGVGTADGQSVTGYKLPDNLNAVPVPVTLFFSPNLSPTVYEKGTDKKVDKKISKLVIVDRDLKLRGGSLISEEGYAVEFKPNSDLMVYQDADFNKKSDSGDDVNDGFEDSGSGGSGGGGSGGGSGDNGLMPMPVYGYPVVPPVPPTPTPPTNTVTVGGTVLSRPIDLTGHVQIPLDTGGGGNVPQGGGVNVNTPPPISRPRPVPRPRPRPRPPVGRPRPIPRPRPRPSGRHFDGTEDIDGSFNY